MLWTGWLVLAIAGQNKPGGGLPEVARIVSERARGSFENARKLDQVRIRMVTMRGQAASPEDGLSGKFSETPKAGLWTMTRRQPWTRLRFEPAPPKDRIDANPEAGPGVTWVFSEAFAFGGPDGAAITVDRDFIPRLPSIGPIDLDRLIAWHRELPDVESAKEGETVTLLDDQPFDGRPRPALRVTRPKKNEALLLMSDPALGHAGVARIQNTAKEPGRMLSVLKGFKFQQLKSGAWIPSIVRRIKPVSAGANEVNVLQITVIEVTEGPVRDEDLSCELTDVRLVDNRIAGSSTRPEKNLVSLADFTADGRFKSANGSATSENPASPTSLPPQTLLLIGGLGVVGIGLVAVLLWPKQGRAKSRRI